MKKPLFGRILSTLMIVILLCLGTGITARAATFTVTKTADTNDGTCNADCSLREAILAANANPGDDTVVLPGGTYVLSIAGQSEDAGATGDLDINGGLTIQGDGWDQTIIDANHTDRVIQILGDATVTINGVHITRGKTPDGDVGGGIFNQGSLLLNNSKVSANSAFATDCMASSGGGIYNQDQLTLENTTVTDNSATWGGGIYNGGNLTISKSLINANNGANGGGIKHSGSTATITQSSILDNHAMIFCQSGFAQVGNFGGGVFVSGWIELEDTLISGNEDRSAAIYAYPAASTVILSRTTLSNNVKGGIYNQGATIKISNSTISSNGGNGVSNTHAGQAILTSSTISLNGGLSGGLSNTTDGSFIVRNSLVAGNSGSTTRDISGTFSSDGYNLIGISNGGAGFTAVGDQVGTIASPIDPKLDVLKDNGGYTPTHALLPGSPAIDAANPTGCTDHDNLPLTIDQRHASRPSGSQCDIGSFEAIASQLEINYTSGAPGSYFTLTGKDFQPNATASIKVNGNKLGTVSTDDSGNLNFILNTDLADEGFYTVTASTTVSASASFAIKLTEPVRPKEGTGQVFNVPAGIAFEHLNLPIIRR